MSLSFPVAPMKATMGSMPAGDGWAFEIKWDGYRTLAFVDGDRVRLQSTSGKDVTERWPEFADLPGSVHADRAILDGADEGFLRLHLKAGGDTILGATLVADHAGEIIATLALAIHSGIGLSTIAESILPYPTQAEIIKRAADDYNRRRLTPRRKKWLERYFAWRR